MPEDGVLIGRLRVRGTISDPLAAQLRLASLLGGADLRPPGLPPATIFCVRRLADPLPGALSLRDPGVWPPAAWQRAVEAALAELAREAARPALAPPPANARAVLFADRAEMLACLAGDWQQGALGGQWWWRSLLRGGSGVTTVLAAWLDRPECIPAALLKLAEGRGATAFARALAPEAALALARAAAQAYALPALVAALVESQAPRVPASAVPEPEEPTLAGSTPGSLPSGRRPARAAGRAAPVPPPAAPWLPWAPESAEPGLSPEGRCLLGVGLALARTPAARSPAFARQVQAWRQAAAAPHTPDGPPAPGRPALPLQAARPPGPAALRERPAAQPAAAQEPATTGGSGASEAPATVTAAPSVADATDRRASPTWARAGGEPGTAVWDTPPAAEMCEAVVDTALGGLFYLVNLGQYLGLYGDFTAPLEPGLGLPIWDFVTLLGGALLAPAGDEAAAAPDDPVWDLLRRLAGRTRQQRPGHGWRPPSTWRLPPVWLAPFAGAGPWTWSVADRRMRVWHPAGFAVLDVPLGRSDPARLLARELAAYGEQGPAVGEGSTPPAPPQRGGEEAPLPLRGGPRPPERSGVGEVGGGGAAPVRRWLGWLLPYVRARLALALGLPPGSDPGPMLLAHPARVFVTATRVDVVLSLDGLPIAIRLAGLDRDPSWVPAAGRYVAFHFE